VGSSPITALISVFVLGNTGTAVCSALRQSVPQGFLLLYYVGVAWAFSWWVLSDCRERGIQTSIDHGWFVFYAWPVVVPYHVLRTRGIRGFGFLLALLAAFLAAYGIALVAFFLLAPR